MVKRCTKIIFVNVSLSRLTLVTTVAGKIFDYSSSNYISLRKGDVGLYEDYIYLIHNINLTEFESIIGDISDLRKMFSISEQKESLDADANEMSRLLSSLKLGERRHRRSIDFLGSAIKFIAGTPDHDDFVLLGERQSRLVGAQNQQVEVNSELTEKINELTERINLIKKEYYDISEPRFPELFQIITIRNQRVISLLTNAVYSVTLAQLNIVNPVILTDQGVLSIVKQEEIPITISELTSSSTVKIYVSNNVFKYLVKVPNIITICSLIVVYPVIHNNTILDLSNRYVAECKKKHTATG